MATTSSKLDIGALKRLRILCVSETGWFDTATVFDDIRAAGGAQVDQYAIPWPPFGSLHAENAAGFSALLETEALDGSVRRLLFDTGWNPDWMDPVSYTHLDVYKRQGEHPSRRFPEPLEFRVTRYGPSLLKAASTSAAIVASQRAG